MKKDPSELEDESEDNDIMIESGVYGSNSIRKVLKGKIHNRGARAHKILFEALTRQGWDWLVSQDNVEFNTREINQLLVACQNLPGWRKFSAMYFQAFTVPRSSCSSTQVLSQSTI